MAADQITSVVNAVDTVLDQILPISGLSPKQKRALDRMKSQMERSLSRLKVRPASEIAKSQVKKAWSLRLKDVGFTGRGRPTSEMITRAVSGMTRKEIDVLLTMRNEIPHQAIRNDSESFSSLFAK